MFEVIKKSILAGIGAVAFTEEKIWEVIEEFVRKGKLTHQEGQTLLEELRKTLEEHKTRLAATIDERINCLMRELNLPTKDDIETMQGNMKKEFGKLERRLTKLEKQLRSNEY